MGSTINGNTQDIYEVVAYSDGTGGNAAEERWEILEYKNNKFISKFGLMDYAKFHKAIKSLKITLQSKYGNPKGFDEAW